MHLKDFVAHISNDGRLGLKFQQVVGMHGTHDQPVDDHMTGLDLAGDTGFLTDHQDAWLLARSDHIANDFTVDAKAFGETYFAPNDGTFADQRADGRLSLFSKHGSSPLGTGGKAGEFRA